MCSARAGHKAAGSVPGGTGGCDRRRWRQRRSRNGKPVRWAEKVATASSFRGRQVSRRRENGGVSHHASCGCSTSGPPARAGGSRRRMRQLRAARPSGGAGSRTQRVRARGGRRLKDWSESRKSWDGRTQCKLREPQGRSPRDIKMGGVSRNGPRQKTNRDAQPKGCAIRMACKTGRFQRRKPMDLVSA